jgi:peptidoglycan-associated lipoprotein
MKNFKMMRYVMVLAIISFLAIGCAKTPSEDMSTKTSDTSASQTTDNGMNSGMTETPVVEKAAGTISDLTRVYFDFDSYVLSADTRATLKHNAMVLKAAPMLKVRIEGHCDERGSDDYNLALGEQRAQATMDYLSSLGVSVSQMATVSMGELMPLDQSGTEAAWAKNRRAEFKAQ